MKHLLYIISSYCMYREHWYETPAVHHHQLIVCTGNTGMKHQLYIIISYCMYREHWYETPAVHHHQLIVCTGNTGMKHQLYIIISYCMYREHWYETPAVHHHQLINMYREHGMKHLLYTIISLSISNINSSVNSYIYVHDMDTRYWEGEGGGGREGGGGGHKNEGCLSYMETPEGDKVGDCKHVNNQPKIYVYSVHIVYYRYK